MQVTKLPNIVDPRRTITGPSTPSTNTGASGDQQTRLDEQKQAFSDMMGRLKTNAQLAAIMLNPIFAPQASAIAMQASGRALYRYENEVPQKDLDTLMNEEQTKAQQQIMQLPQVYYNATSHAVQVTGQAVGTAAKTAGQGIAIGALGLFAGLKFGAQAILRGIGASLHWVGSLYEGAGNKLSQWGQS